MKRPKACPRCKRYDWKKKKDEFSELEEGNTKQGEFSELEAGGSNDSNTHGAPEPQKQTQPLPSKGIEGCGMSEMALKIGEQINRKFLPTELDSKHKHCPRCREPILKAWMRHDKCGWVA